ncbi:MAG: competence/damage-inducible protein CinA [Solirubrobacterales bacterium]|nr:competence/damage-inducible protein CinA [Solirubrobacterales bacterium]
MTARAGVVITGTEVLSGIITDRNGPWLSERLREAGIDLESIVIVGDRREDMLSALEYLAGEKVDVVVTSGGLGPTADDLTAEVVGEFQGRPMVLDEPLEERIAEILRPLMERFPNLDHEAVRISNRKQAVIPDGSTVIEPVGTAPGLVVPPGDELGGPTIVVLPGPPRELHAMWRAAVDTQPFRRATRGAVTYETRVMRLFGIPESEIAADLRAIEEEGVDLSRLEITTCLRRGEIEVATRFEPRAAKTYAKLEQAIAERHGEILYSRDGSTIDDQVAELLADGPHTIATAESCTGGLLAVRLTDRAGSSAYVLGGLVTYSNEAKVALAGVDPALIERVGAVSVEVAEAMADGAISRLGAELGVGITGIAGPDGGTEDKPVGTVCVSVANRDGARLTRRMRLPGNRADIRDRSATVALHLVRRLLLGESDAAAEA